MYILNQKDIIEEQKIKKKIPWSNMLSKYGNQNRIISRRKRRDKQLTIRISQLAMHQQQRQKRLYWILNIKRIIKWAKKEGLKSLDKTTLHIFSKLFQNFTDLRQTLETHKKPRTSPVTSITWGAKCCVTSWNPYTHKQHKWRERSIS